MNTRIMKDQIGRLINYTPPPSLFDSIGTQYLTWQYNASKPCRASLDPDGAQSAAWAVETIGLPGSKLLYISMRVHALLVSVEENGGKCLDDAGVKALGDAGFRVRRDAYREWKPWNQKFTFVAYLVPEAFTQAKQAVAETASLANDATDALPVGVTRFLKAFAPALAAFGSLVTVDSVAVRAVQRSATLPPYSADHDVPDTARRVHARDLDAAVEAGAVSRAVIDGETWVFRPA